VVFWVFLPKARFSNANFRSLKTMEQKNDWISFRELISNQRNGRLSLSAQKQSRLAFLPGDIFRTASEYAERRLIEQWRGGRSPFDLGN
jgi:hypothetical protein